MKLNLKTKLPKVETSIFTVMSQLANDHNALNLSQGFPDFDCPEHLRNLVTFHMNEGKNQYAPMTGIPELREQISIKLEQMYGRKICMNQEITVTSGATEALFSAIHSVVCPGDEVIVFDPAYDSYEPAIDLAGGKTIHLPLLSPRYKPDWDLVKSSITQQTRMIIINTPHNPTGTVFDAEDMIALSGLLENTNIIVLSDEVYEHMIFDNIPHQSVLRYDALAERSFAVFSFGKTYHATGWKIGYCVAPAALSTEFRKIHQFVTFTTATPLQYALSDFMKQCPEHYLELPQFYQAKRDKFCQLLQNSRFSFTPSQGTYFQLLDYSNITDLPDTEYANLLTQEAGIASIPVSVFFQHNTRVFILRFCFAKDDTTLEEAADILCKI